MFDSMGRRPTAFAPRWGLTLFALLAAWQPLAAHQPHDPMSVVALSPNFAQDQTLFVATSAITMPLPVSEYLNFVSTNGGFTFSVLPGLPNQQMFSIAISPGFATDGTVFMAGAGGLWMTTNSGTSWQAVGGAPLISQVVAVAVTPNFTTSGVAFAITKNGVYTSSNHGSTWQHATTPSSLSSNLTALSISSNYAVDSTLMVGSGSNGIFLSTNAGQSWSSVTSGLTLPPISNITFSSAFATDRTVFAATMGNGVYISTNGGTTFTQAASGLTDPNVSTLTLSPTFTTDNILWASTASAGVFESQNRATNWAVTGTIPRPLSPQTKVHYTTLAAAKASTGTALFVGMFEGLWRSYNAGTNWSYCDTIPTRLVRDLQLSPNYVNDQTVFASTYGGGTLWSFSGGLSSSSGGAWTFRNTALTDAYTDANAIAPNYSTNGIAWIGTTTGLLRISGGSSIWTPMKDCGKQTFPRSLGLSSGFATDDTMFIGTHAGTAYPATVTCGGETVPNRGLFESVNAGLNWEPTGLQNIASDAIGMSPNFPVDHTLFVGSSLSGLYKTTDGGMTFAPITVVAGDNGTLPVACSPAFATDQTVFAGTSHSGLFKSTDGGNSWTQLPNTSVLTAFSFAISPNFANDQTLFVGTLQQGLLKSTDGGNTLVPIAPTLGPFASAVSISPGYATDNTVFVATYLGLYKSTDGGNTWVYTKEPARQEEERASGQQGFATITYTGNWSYTADSGASTIQLATTSQAGASASLTFLGSGVAYIGQKNPTGGIAQIMLDGVTQAMVNLNSTTTQEQQQLWGKDGLPCAAHTITINAMPASGQSVNLDALDLKQDTCPLATAGSRQAPKTPAAKSQKPETGR